MLEDLRTLTEAANRIDDPTVARAASDARTAAVEFEATLRSGRQDRLDDVVAGLATVLGFCTDRGVIEGET